MSSEIAVKADHITKTYFSRYEQVEALQPTTFSITRGQFVSFVGASGCGKSTILSLIAGLLSPTSGKLHLFGSPVTSPSPQIGYMLQQDCLLDWRTVAENITLGLSFRGTLNRKTAQQACTLLEELGLAHIQHYYPKQLSGGMRQRVALVRTLAVLPNILLLDEPFSALDYQNKLYLEELIQSVLKQQQMTALLVTHDLEEALALSERIFVISGRPGTISHILDIPAEIQHASPLEARGKPLFRSLFNELWKEIESS